MTKSNQGKFYLELGSAIREARKNIEYSQEYVSLKVGKSRASIVNIEKGRQHPPPHLIWELAELLKVKVSELIPKFTALDENEINNVFERKINKTAEMGRINEDSRKKINSFVTKS